MLPDGWARYLLGDIVSFKNGLNYTRSDNGESIKIVGVSDFKSRSQLASMDGLATIQVANSVREAELLASGDLLFVRSNGNRELIGRCLYFPHVEERLAFSGFTIRGRVDTTVLDPFFASHLMRSTVVTDQIFLGGSGTNISNLSQEILSGIQVNVPSLAEQRRIARIIDTWDRATSVTEQVLANRRMQWQALLAATLHLPPANPDAGGADDNGGFPRSVQAGIPNLPETPKGWQRMPLGPHVCEVRRPVQLKADEDYRLITVKRSRGGVFLREVLPGREVKTPTQAHVRVGDFLISKRQIVHGACGLVPTELDGAVVSNEYAVLNSDGVIDLKFLRYLSETRYFQQTCFHSSIGVHVEKMIFKTERWLKWPFNIPPLDVQRRVVEVLDVACREMELIAAQVALLKREKAALSSQLLTGKRCVCLSEHETGVAA
jgi:type I restriction enzyme S subunit